MNSIPNERVCDLVDGRVPDGECVQAFEALLSDDQAAQTWHTYHVIGDVLRSAELAPTSSDYAFLERLERRLALEPLRPVVTESEPPVVAHLGLPSANAPVFRWKVLAGVASFALVGVVGLGLWTQTDQHGDAQIAAQSVVAPRASASSLVVADTGAGTMLRDARLDELMAAHRQLGGHSALQVPTGFLHTATYEGPAR
nr:sigma-E factor negative regulatory protein [Rhodoferax sp.]